MIEIESQLVSIRISDPSLSMLKIFKALHLLKNIKKMSKASPKMDSFTMKNKTNNKLIKKSRRLKMKKAWMK
jgi:hypothetical protein